MTTAKFQIRRDTYQGWHDANPKLSLGEIGYETDSKKFKVGDGNTFWNSLDYSTLSPTEIHSYVDDAVGSIVIPTQYISSVGSHLSVDSVGNLTVDLSSYALSSDIPSLSGYLTSSNAASTYLTISNASSTYATPENITTAINNLVNGAPAALNTLKELADAINDDASYAASVTTSLGLKATIDSPTFTGTVSGITKSMVGLGNVDNTSDINKPISSATQTALDAKLSSTTASSTYSPIAGSSSITTVGTISSGTWSGSTIPINKGGTGATTQAAAANAILPSQSSNSGKYLTTDGTNVSWSTLNSYSPPILGITTINSGSTVSSIQGLELSQPTFRTFGNTVSVPMSNVAYYYNGSNPYIAIVYTTTMSGVYATVANYIYQKGVNTNLRITISGVTGSKSSYNGVTAVVPASSGGAGTPLSIYLPNTGPLAGFANATAGWTSSVYGSGFKLDIQIQDDFIVSSNEIKYLQGVTSNIQDQISQFTLPVGATLEQTTLQSPTIRQPSIYWPTNNVHVPGEIGQFYATFEAFRYAVDLQTVVQHNYITGGGGSGQTVFEIVYDLQYSTVDSTGAYDTAGTGSWLLPEPTYQVLDGATGTGTVVEYGTELSYTGQDFTSYDGVENTMTWSFSHIGGTQYKLDITVDTGQPLNNLPNYGKVETGRYWFNSNDYNDPVTVFTLNGLITQPLSEEKLSYLLNVSSDIQAQLDAIVARLNAANL